MRAIRIRSKKYGCTGRRFGLSAEGGESGNDKCLSLLKQNAARKTPLRIFEHGESPRRILSLQSFSRGSNETSFGARRIRLTASDGMWCAHSVERGNRRTFGCRKCLCDDSGQWACTKVNCTTPPPTPVCHPTERRYEDCNICTCTDEGQWACTKMSCPPVSFVCKTDTAASCDKSPVFALEPSTGTCCYYDFACQVPGKWDTFPTLSDCAGGANVPGSPK